MQVYIIVYSALICSLVAAKFCKEGRSRVMKIQKEIKTAKCPCTETSVVPHNHYHETACTCFQIPEENNCNLSCFKDGVNKYKGIITHGHSGKFIQSSFAIRVELCTNFTCVQPCGHMTTVNADVFWKKLQKAFEQMMSFV